jgi:hypothetical protein
VSTTQTELTPSVTYARLPSGLTATFWGEDCFAVAVVTEESPISMVETVSSAGMLISDMLCDEGCAT